MSNSQDIELSEVSADNMRKAFALACRFIADIAVGCPNGYLVGYSNSGCTDADTQCDKAWKCWQQYFLDRVASEPVCRVCGCTQNNACPPDGCHWVEKDLCSACAERQKAREKKASS